MRGIPKSLLGLDLLTLWRGKRSIIESLDCTVTSDTALILLSSIALFLTRLIFSLRIWQCTCHPTLSWLQAISDNRPITATTMSKHAWKHMHTYLFVNNSLQACLQTYVYIVCVCTVYIACMCFQCGTWWQRLTEEVSRIGWIYSVWLVTQELENFPGQ